MMIVGLLGLFSGKLSENFSMNIFFGGNDIPEGIQEL